jgi:hypothetical protein
MYNKWTVFAPDHEQTSQLFTLYVPLHALDIPYVISKEQCLYKH